MDEQLIELVRNYEELYNLGDKLYFDALHKNKRWKEIAEKLNKTANECKVRWESLRSQFRKICKLRQTTTGQAAKKRKKWRYEEEMTFLVPHMKDKERMSSLDVGDDSDKNEEEEDEIEGETEVGARESEQDATQDISENDSTSNTPVSRNKKSLGPRKKHPAEAASATLMKYIISQKELENAKAQKAEKDNIDLFFDSIKATVRSFSPADFHLTKTRIFNIVSEIETKYILPTNSRPYDHQSPHIQNTSGFYNFPFGSGYNNYNRQGGPPLPVHTQAAATPETTSTSGSSSSTYYEM